MTLRGLISALPDAATATLYAICWAVPAKLGYPWIKTLMLVMLIEFLVVHSSGFIGQIVLSDASRGIKLKAIVGFGAFYMLFVQAFCLALGEWWPVAAFGWLLVGKFLMVVLERRPRAEERQRLTRCGRCRSSRICSRCLPPCCCRYRSSASMPPRARPRRSPAAGCGSNSHRPWLRQDCSISRCWRGSRPARRHPRLAHHMKTRQTRSNPERGCS